MIKVTPLIQNIKQEVIKLKDLYEYANYLKKNSCRNMNLNNNITKTLYHWLTKNNTILIQHCLLMHDSYGNVISQ